MAKKKIHDFKKPKIKVGKKLPRNLNLTNIQMKVKKVILPNQTSDFSIKEDEKIIDDLINQLLETNPTRIKRALIHLKKIISKDTHLSLYVIENHCDNLLNILVSNVWDCTLITYEVIEKIIIYQHLLDPSFFERLWSCLHVQTTHFNHKIRATSLNFILKNYKHFSSLFFKSNFPNYKYLSLFLDDLLANNFLSDESILRKNFLSYISIFSYFLKLPDAKNSTSSLTSLNEFPLLKNTDEITFFLKHLEEIIYKYLVCLNFDVSKCKENIIFLSSFAELTIMIVENHSLIKKPQSNRTNFVSKILIVVLFNYQTIMSNFGYDTTASLLNKPKEVKRHPAIEFKIFDLILNRTIKLLNDDNLSEFFYKFPLHHLFKLIKSILKLKQLLIISSKRSLHDSFLHFIALISEHDKTSLEFYWTDIVDILCEYNSIEPLKITNPKQRFGLINIISTLCSKINYQSEANALLLYASQTFPDISSTPKKEIISFKDILKSITLPFTLEGEALNFINRFIYGEEFIKS